MSGSTSANANIARFRKSFPALPMEPSVTRRHNVLLLMPLIATAASKLIQFMG